MNTSEAESKDPVADEEVSLDHNHGSNEIEESGMVRRGGSDISAPDTSSSEVCNNSFHNQVATALVEPEISPSRDQKEKAKKKALGFFAPQSRIAKDGMTTNSNSTSDRPQDAKEIDRAVVISDTVAAAKEAEANKRFEAQTAKNFQAVRNHQDQDKKKDIVEERGRNSTTTENRPEDEVIGSIQPLPDLQAFAQASPQIGAYAVLSPRDAIETTQSIPAVQGSQGGSDIEAGTSAVDTNDDQNDLVEAELVDSDVVMAEKLNESSNKRRKPSLALIVAAVVILALIVTVVTLVARKGGESSNSVASNAGDTSSSINDFPPEVEPPDAGPCSAFASFNSSEELFAAASAFFMDPSPTSNVSQKYGWPIGSWCVGNIDNFNYVLDSSQEREAFGNFSSKVLRRVSHFHEDIGDWDMSKAWKMSDMLRNAQNLSATWGIDRWDISSCGDLSGVFQDTQWRQPMLDVSTWDTRNVWSMALMLKNSNVEVPGIANWNTAKLEQLYGFADGASNFNEDIGNWNTHKVFTLQKSFKNAKNFNQDLSRWNTKSLKKLNMAFWGTESFNQDLSAWDTSLVQTMHDAFQNSAFNNDISSWNVSRVTTMARMFLNSDFNQDISNWDVFRVTELQQAFDGAAKFSQNLCAWGSRLPANARTKDMFKGTACPNTADPLGLQGPFCFDCDRRSFNSREELFDAVTAYLDDSSSTSNVSHMYGWPIGTWQVSGISKFESLFALNPSETRNLTGEALNRTAAFRADIGDWNIRSVTTLGEMFLGMKNLSAAWGIDRWDTSSIRVLRGAFKRTQWTEPKLNLSSWDISRVRALAQTFAWSDVERPGVSNWDTSNVDILYQVAAWTNNFNEDISGWNTEKVTAMHYAFQGALSFNQDLSGWNTSSVTHVQGAFKHAMSFNGALSGWDVSKVKKLQNMFYQSAFNQDISMWDVSKVEMLSFTFRESAFNQDISSWNVSSATALQLAFKDAKNFSQNLCAWGSLLPPNAKIHEMFAGTACPNTSDPVIPGGPFCFNCE